MLHNFGTVITVSTLCYLIRSLNYFKCCGEAPMGTARNCHTQVEANQTQG